jgi:hypothetical protein
MRHFVRLNLLASLTLTLAAGSAFAEDDFKLEDGFKSLFNGKDLTGWVLNARGKSAPLDKETATPDGKWKVVDGAITLTAGANGNLYTKDSFDKDFQLKLEFKPAKNADSGLFIRGKQLQVRDYANAGPYKSLKTFHTDGWNLLEVSVSGQVAECKCNGEVIEKTFAVPKTGAIGLQTERGNFAFRRIRIKVAE